MRLPSIATRNNGFTLIDLSYPEELSEVLGLDLTVALNHQVYKEVLEILLSAIAGASSGVVLDPTWSLPIWSDLHGATAEPIGSGIALSLISERTPAGEVPKISSTWGLDEIKNNYAVPILTLNYNSSEPNALAKKQFIAELKDYCEYQELDLALELEITGAQPEVLPTAEDLVTALQELQRYAKLLILPTPADALTAATITAELDRPWIVRVNPAAYDAQKEVVRTAVEAGARGFIARSLWQDLSLFRQPQSGVNVEAIRNFAKTTLRDRLLELSRITAESGGY